MGVNFFKFYFPPFLHLKKSFYIVQVGQNPSPEYAAAWDNQRGQLHLTVESQRLQALDRQNLLPGCSNSTTPAGFRCFKEHVANALPLLHHLAQPGFQAEKSAPVHQHWPGLKYTRTSLSTFENATQLRVTSPNTPAFPWHPEPSYPHREFSSSTTFSVSEDFLIA